jgi:hypothetical protein
MPDVVALVVMNKEFGEGKSRSCYDPEGTYDGWFGCTLATMATVAMSLSFFP